MKTIQPLNKPSETPQNPSSQAESAADLIRHKLDALYIDEPNAKEELIKVADQPEHQSKHQEYMHNLSTSGMSLAEIQTAWHKYYADLDDAGKHEVWREFYANHEQKSRQPKPSIATKTIEPEAKKPQAITSTSAHDQTLSADETQDENKDERTVADIKNEITKTIRTRRKPTAKDHLKSLAFGLGAGVIAIAIVLMGFFNEKFIAPFITPSKSISNTSIIIDPSSTAAGPESKLIIPKINAELPVSYDQKSISENDIQTALESGVVHYATTSLPGEKGNGAIFGHSSNNILNKGKYKFAFVLLNRLENGDTFIVQKDSKRYVYKVINVKVVPPTETSVLSDTFGKSSTFSLITCDPPGTSTNRRVVTGEQITPDPSSNIASTSPATTQQSEAPEILPSNSPSLWSRLTSWL